MHPSHSGAGAKERGQGDAFATGTLPGGGSFRCRGCGYLVSLTALDEVPECPSCGGQRFGRASIFGSRSAIEPHVPEGESLDWVESLRRRAQEPGHYLALADHDRLTLIRLTREWTRIGRSMTADVRLDDPTVSRRHAILVRQGEGVRVLDDRSLNGIYVNGRKQEWSRLRDGDSIVIGRYQLVFLVVPGTRLPAEQDYLPAGTA